VLPDVPSDRRLRRRGPLGAWDGHHG